MMKRLHDFLKLSEKNENEIRSFIIFHFINTLCFEKFSLFQYRFAHSLLFEE